jgi:hypothetical protein
MGKQSDPPPPPRHGERAVQEARERVRRLDDGAIPRDVRQGVAVPVEPSLESKLGNQICLLHDSRVESPEQKNRRFQACVNCISTLVTVRGCGNVALSKDEHVQPHHGRQGVERLRAGDSARDTVQAKRSDPLGVAVQVEFEANRETRDHFTGARVETTAFKLWVNFESKL